ncbi:MAG: alpha/beta hydrolase, partial [Deinococcus sp.]
MRHLTVFSLLPLLALSTALAAPVRLRAADGLLLSAEHTPLAHPRGALLLLHAAGQNRHEFRGIAPRLAREGYASLALDQRFGGDYDGFHNQTVPGLGRRILSEADELADIDAAFRWLKRRYPRTPVFALGSGASGVLLFPFAGRAQGLAGILAFSPYKA